jgi:small nuclear ribonucleoprotein (snRNP)-like protein
MFNDLQAPMGNLAVAPFRFYTKALGDWILVRLTSQEVLLGRLMDK